MSSSDEQWRLAVAYYHGDQKGIPHDEKKAFELFSQLAENGHKPSQLELGCLYFMGSEHTKASYTDALKYWGKLSDDPEACYGMGLIYHLGDENIQKDDAKAVKYWKKAANMNNFNAIHMLSQHYPNELLESDSDSVINTPVDLNRSNHFDSLKTPLTPKSMKSGHFDSLTFSSRSQPSSPVNKRVASLQNSLTVTKTQRRGSLIGEINQINRTKPDLVIETSTPRDSSQIDSSKRIINAIGFLKNQIYDLQSSVNFITETSLDEASQTKDEFLAIREELDQQKNHSAQLETMLQEILSNQKKIMESICPM